MTQAKPSKLLRQILSGLDPMSALRSRLGPVRERIEAAVEGVPDKRTPQRRARVRVASADLAQMDRLGIDPAIAALEIENLDGDELVIGARLDWSRRRAPSGFPSSMGLPRPGDQPDADSPWTARGKGSDLGLWTELAQCPPAEEGIGKPTRALTGQAWTLEPCALHKSAPAWMHRLAQKHFEYGLEVLRVWGDERLTHWIESAVVTIPKLGFGLWEIWTRDRLVYLADGAHRLPVPEPPAWISPSAVEHWVSDLYDLRAVICDFSAQTTYTGQWKGRTALPIERLVHVRRRGFGANWEGVSALRPAYQPLEMWRACYQLQALSVEIGALGWSYVTAGERAVEADVQRMKQHLGAFTAREIPYGLLPHGWDFKWIKPDDLTVGLVEVLRMYREDIASALATTSSLTGLGGRGGSFALQADRSADERGDLRSVARMFIVHPFADLMRKALALAFPLDAAHFAPVLTPADMTARDVGAWLGAMRTAAEAKTADGTPLLYADDEIGQAVRRELSVPERLDAHAPADVQPGADADAEADASTISAELLRDLRLAHDSGILHDADLGPSLRAALGLPPLTPAGLDAFMRLARGASPAQDASAPPIEAPLADPSQAPTFADELVIARLAIARAQAEA